jgi:hypothetical protein
MIHPVHHAKAAVANDTLATEAESARTHASNKIT